MKIPRIFSDADHLRHSSQNPATILGPIARWSAQLVIVLLATFAAFLLRFDFSIPTGQRLNLLAALCWLAATRTLAFRVSGLHRSWWRYFSTADVFQLVGANIVGSAAATAGLLCFGPMNFPRSVLVLDLLLGILMTSGARLGVRIACDLSRHSGRSIHARALIYGAGAAGMALLRQIEQNPGLPYKVGGLIDDAPEKVGLCIHGKTVFGSGEALPAIVAAHAVEVVLIAMPSATGEQMRAVLNHCLRAGVTYKTVPSLAEFLDGRELACQIRDVAVDDLLGRSPVRLEDDRIRASLSGTMVLVTGAAGSIGSELCRQIARFEPAGIVGFEIAESPLFEIDREMRQSFPDVPFYPEIGSIQDRDRLDDVFEKYAPSVVYHAAAYKHVPMMEAHVFQAIRNNVFGTFKVAMAAHEHAVDAFVMISSDKAVRPTNVMGASKRIAELLLLTIQKTSTAKFVAVRFGNVLGSNGSVIPIFKKQIAVGGPVTVTHPEMQRYFMTIPEACQLVLQSAVIAQSGQICVLDMGEPVKIVDLARNLILLSGLRPDEDIKIEFVGSRPGEKLYEELNAMNEDTVPTTHEKVRIFKGNGVPEEPLDSWLERLEEICLARDTGSLVLALKELVSDYNPSTYVLKQAMTDRSAAPKSPHIAVLTIRKSREQSSAQPFLTA